MDSEDLCKSCGIAWRIPYKELCKDCFDSQSAVPEPKREDLAGDALRHTELWRKYRGVGTPPTPADICKVHAEIWGREAEAIGECMVSLRNDVDIASYERVLELCQSIAERYETKAQETEG